MEITLGKNIRGPKYFLARAPKFPNPALPLLHVPLISSCISIIHIVRKENYSRFRGLEFERQSNIPMTVFTNGARLKIDKTSYGKFVPLSCFYEVIIHGK